MRRLHEKIFYRPLLAAVAKLAGDDARLSLDAAEARLAALGYDDPKGALRHLEALTSGVSRTSDIQRTLLPVMLAWFADSPDPDAGLFGFRRLSESLGRTPWYLKMLRDEGEVAQRLAFLLGTSRYATDLLEREPQGVRMLGGDLSPLSAEALTTEMQSVASRQSDPEEAVRAIRAVRRRELLRIACGDLVGETDVALVGAGLSRLTDATLEATLAVAMDAVRATRGLDAEPSRMAIIAMGRYGGFELSYGSDADVMFVHEPVDGVEPQVAAAYAQAVVGELRRLLSLPATDPPLVVDADLRPEGKQGPMVRTLASFEAYYAKWSHVWEFQALLRADAVVGDPELRERFTALIDPLRFPSEGIARRRHRGGAPDQGPRRRRAAAARRRPQHAPQARSRRARRRRVDRPAPADATRRRGARAPHHPDARGARGRGGRGADRERGRRGPGRGLAAGEPDAQRDHAGPRQAVGPGAAGRDGAGRGGAGARLSRPATRTGWSTTTSAPPVGRTRSWRRCSGENEVFDFIDRLK